MKIETLRDAERYLDGLINREQKTQYDYERLGLGPIRALLAAVGSPERGFPCLLVAGSKGKGTTTLAAEQLLRGAGRRVGAFTKPHLESWRERFRVDGELVAEGDLVAALRDIQPAIEGLRGDTERCPSFFDVTVALALVLFRRAGAEVGAIEVGLGGRLDSTNAVDARVTVVTAIQLEHTDKLGDTLEAIAREKAGIFRAGVPALHGALAPEAWGAVAAQAIAVDAPLEEVRALDVRADRAGLRFRLSDGRALASPVLGAHQAGNLALAVRAVELHLGRTLAASELATLGSLRLPARVEPIGDAIVDDAHTPDSARALRETLAALWPDTRWVFVLSISRDKDAAGILAELAPVTRACVATAAEATRSLDPEEIASLAWAAGIGAVETQPEPVKALARARELLHPGDRIAVSGSVFLAGALRRHLVAAARPV
ncbi:MAG TPA: Mur ligase family protein [Myxococcota bacterium]|nr:Mur ligase family protein [Myxococcota bacterium]